LLRCHENVVPFFYTRIHIYIYIYRAMKQICLLCFEITREHVQFLAETYYQHIYGSSSIFTVGLQADLDTSNTSIAIQPCITRKQKILHHLFRVLYAKILNAASRLCISRSAAHYQSSSSFSSSARIVSIDSQNKTRQGR
jgi:hypothetical protein